MTPTEARRRDEPYNTKSERDVPHQGPIEESMSRELKIFSGNANPPLAHEICAYLGTKLGEATVSSFSDG